MSKGEIGRFRRATQIAHRFNPRSAALVRVLFMKENTC